ncbi:hypothetical protein U1Q18_047193 [Sarracenia purpurea var. burkii]
MVSFTSIPQWLEILLGERFFNSCLTHELDKKNEKNTFCLDCCISLCPHCLPPHPSHRLLQIRRYVYQDVIRLNDAQKLIDCSSVQVQNMVRNTKAGLTGRHFCNCEVKGVRMESSSELEGGQMTPISVLELPISVRTMSGSSSSSVGALNCNRTASTLACTATTEFVRKKRTVSVCRTRYRPVCAPTAGTADAVNRRKGVPHRSPLY